MRFTPVSICGASAPAAPLSVCGPFSGFPESKRPRASGEVFKIKPGSFYALDNHDEHYLRAFEDLELACVFSPALVGSEVHQADGSYTLVADIE